MSNLTLSLPKLSLYERLQNYLWQPVPALPFQVFRAVFGALMIFGTIRFMALGWIEDHYLNPIFHFKYYGFAWVEPLDKTGLYAIHFLMIFAALGVAVATNWLYRISAITLFLTFTYTELIDLTYYLNHYYYVSLVCLLLCIIPTPPKLFDKTAQIPFWVIGIFKFQIAIVYIYAGLAKINYDWLILALPLKIWLPAHDKMPLIGEIFTWQITPYLFSWAGMLYDCFIVFFLAYKPTRFVAYIFVVIFHTLVGLLFQIGVFPLVMIGGTLIFFDFSSKQNEQKLAPKNNFSTHYAANFSAPFPAFYQKFVFIFLFVYCTFQLLFPWRYLLYQGNLFWTEEGYRFSWRVMLMEKAGTATFYVKDSRTGREGVVDNSEFLNPHQEKQMAMQPDMILQFAHFLAKHYEKKGVHQPQVRAEVYVTLNARPSKLFINPTIDLTKQTDSFAPKTWILPYDE
ncbi:MAG: HTTM domain-containing protein [Bacteroidia bacterium]|nr:HTTM domain-containing protein [Bacteroidia bacterium]MDW8300867.1 HTTM domain-containing protein [Bacteroidia bacterium]